MLGVIATSLAGSPIKVVQSEHAGHCPGPNIVFPKRPRSGRDPKVRRASKEPKPGDFTTRSIVPRSFLAV
jgi:hypothetical protein